MSNIFKHRVHGSFVLFTVALVAMRCIATETTISEPTELTVSQDSLTNWSPLYVNADLTVNTGGCLYLHWAGNIYLPGKADASATLTTTNSGYMDFYYTEPGNPNYINIGKFGGKGHIHIAGGGSKQNYCNHLKVWPLAQADESGYIDYLRISANDFRASHEITNETPARVTMAGGTLFVAKSATGTIRDLFNIAANSKLVLASENGATLQIGLNQGDKHPWVNFNAGEGRFETTGDGDLLFGSNGGARCHVFFLMGPDRATWGHKGKTVFKDNFTAVVCCDQALPHGPNTGAIYFRSQNQAQPKYIDLNGHTTEVNGLYYDGDVWASEQCSWVTNSSETAEGVMQFGGLNTELAITQSIKFTGNSVLEKIGTNTLMITSGIYPHLRVTSGTLDLRGTHTIDTIEVASNATLIVNGAAITVRKITNNYGTITFANNGFIANDDCIYEDSIDTSTMPSRWTKYSIMDRGYAPYATVRKLNIVKKNTDTFTLFDSSATIGDVSVLSGRLRIGGEANTNHYPWWRLTIKKAFGSIARSQGDVKKTMQAGISRWWITQSDLTGESDPANETGPSLLGWGKNADVGTAPKELEEGGWTTGKDFVVAAGANTFASGAVWGGPATLGRPFYNKSYEFYYATVFANDCPDPETPSTWETIVCRLRNTSAAKTIGGYLLSAAGNGAEVRPTVWTVEGSQDGENWVLLDSRDERDISTYGKNGWWMNNGNLYLFNRNAASWSFRPQGIVSVASGALLDLTEIPSDNIAIAKLSIDQAAGSGEIRPFVPAQEGCVYLTNVPGEGLDGEGQITRRIKVAMAFTEVGNATAIRNWKVFANGIEQTDTAPRFTEKGELIVRKVTGLRVIVR